MKRFNKTAVALATAGAMTMAMVPNATARENEAETPFEGTPVEDILNENPNDYPEKLDESLLVGEGESNTQRAVDEEGYTRAEDSDSDMKPEDLPDGGVVGETNATYVPGNGVDNSEELKPEDVFDEEGDEQDNAAIPPAQTIPNPNNPDEECYLHNSGEFYVFDRNDWNTPADEIDEKCEPVVDDEQDPAEEEGASKVLRALAGLAGVGAVIYLLGQAYKAVTSSSGNPVLVPVERADQAPTAEDEAATDQLVADHGEEIVAQAAEAGVADNGAAADNDADADRGVSAATGNNNIAQGLIGLLLASILGAAAFVFGRRQLV